MTAPNSFGTVMIHPDGNVMGALRWPGTLPAGYLPLIPAALAAVRAHGYFASAYPEGDGITFNLPGDARYDPAASLEVFRSAFTFLDLKELDQKEGLAKALVRLSGERTVTCIYLAPIEGLRLATTFQLGATRFHAPVDGVEVRLADHDWRQFCDVPGADVKPGWAPGRGAKGTTELLAYPLIERKVEVPLSMFHQANASFDGQTALLRLIMENADHALDPLRFDLCHYRRLQYLPAKPGWIGETALAYVIPEGLQLQELFLQGKPYVLRVSNNWLGLDVDDGQLRHAPLLADKVVDRTTGEEIASALKAAVRALNRAFYLVELEASFLHMVYAMDALCSPGKLTGERHRLWITAFASTKDPQNFAQLLGRFDQLYSIRNQIVHNGESFTSLGLAGEEQCQSLLQILGACIETFLREVFNDRQAAAQFAFDALTAPAISAVVAAKDVKLPLTDDKPFKKHMQP
ncbi:hypothetical protein [Sphingomonas aerolata]|uniref:hypothetical protein n=1 Tax=Sphingomonas aerolata TaxID=185951 RepID=UPI002FE179B9